MYQSFDTTEAFETLLLDNLQRLLLEYGEHIEGKPVAAEVVQTFAPKIPDNLPRRAPFFGRDKEMGIALRAPTPVKFVQLALHCISTKTCAGSFGPSYVNPSQP